jgi:hypothetical protein
MPKSKAPGGELRRDNRSLLSCVHEKFQSNCFNTSKRIKPDSDCGPLKPETLPLPLACQMIKICGASSVCSLTSWTRYDRQHNQLSDSPRTVVKPLADCCQTTDRSAEIHVFHVRNLVTALNHHWSSSPPLSLPGDHSGCRVLRGSGGRLRQSGQHRDVRTPEGASLVYLKRAISRCSITSRCLSVQFKGAISRCVHTSMCLYVSFQKGIPNFRVSSL